MIILWGQGCKCAGAVLRETARAHPQGAGMGKCRHHPLGFFQEQRSLGFRRRAMGPGLGPSGKSRWERLDTGALGSQRAWRYSPTLPLPPTPRQFLTFLLEGGG